MEFFWGILRKEVQKQLQLPEDVDRGSKKRILRNLAVGSGFGACKISEFQSRIKAPPPPQISMP